MIQKRYEGYLQTPCLWKGNSVMNLMQFDIDKLSHKINIEINSKLRLGKYVERLVSFELLQHNNIKILAENIQIQQDKITLGELDIVLLKDNTPIHLELIFKFYLYDPTVGTSEIDHFIGPNRKDSLKEKLNKLKEKQLPLLHNTACTTYLNNLNLNAKQLLQQVYFKAQLFLPYANQNIKLNKLNNACIIGFYVKKNELDNFSNAKFYIPQKIDWLLIPHKDVNWLNFEDFQNKLTEYHERSFSPICWVKLKNGELKKVCFVWW